MTVTKRRALVTGSTSGIGLSIARALAQGGCDILLNGFGSAFEIEHLKKSFRSDYGVAVSYFGADVSRPQECKDMVASAMAEWGGLDILVNNAGIQHVAAVEDTSADKWNQVLAINLSAAFHLTAAVLPAMKVNKFGRIVNIASVHGLVGSKYKAAYVAAKHGLVGLSKVIALETAGLGITCNVICPGFVSTPILEAQIAERMHAGNLSRAGAEELLLSEKQPSGQFARVEEVAALATFLCSDAATSLTGASLPIDGGWTAQ